MMMYCGVGDDADCHEPPARVDVPMSIYGGSRLNTIIKFLLYKEAQFVLQLEILPRLYEDDMHFKTVDAYSNSV